MDEEPGARAFAAARAMVGVRFRVQGRCPVTGLDCVGLVWAAYAAAGVRIAAPRDYPLRGWEQERIAAALAAAGFGVAAGPARCGDVALIALAAGQFHLGILGPDRMIHAHAGLRCVVEAPLDDGLRAARRWRLSE